MTTPYSLSHTKWGCKYHTVWIPKYRKKRLFWELRQEEDEDRRVYQLSLWKSFGLKRDSNGLLRQSDWPVKVTFMLI
jgi:hypothetical protein